MNNRTIKQIGKKYLDHNYRTDVITFPYEQDKKALEGEILISLDAVKQNAKTYGTGFSEELKRVIAHGCLHLTGYKDETELESELIRSKENFYLNS